VEDKETAFERDRRTLLEFCDDALKRVEGTTGTRPVAPIAKLAIPIERLELAERLGFPAPPLKFSVRFEAAEKPSYREHVCEWTDPTGCDGGQMTLWALTFEEHDRERYHDLLNDNKRRTLADAMRNWIRAVQCLAEPAVYPCEPRTQCH